MTSLPASPPASWTGRLRRWALPVALWAFGFATSLLLVGGWGRTVAADTATVEDAAQTVVDAQLATERIQSWLESGLNTAIDADSETVRDLAAQVADRPEFSDAVDAIVADFVASLFADTGEEPVVHLDEALAPLVPVVLDEASTRDVPVESESIESVLDTASEIALDTGEAASIATVVDDARTLLTWVVVAAATGLLVAGAAAIALSDRRFAMVRSLATRVVVSALTYALFFRVASWALDPQRGRSPVLGGGSVILGSNAHIFLITAAAATIIGTWGGTVAYRRSRTRPDVGEASDDDTRELVTV